MIIAINASVAAFMSTDRAASATAARAGARLTIRSGLPIAKSAEA